MWKRTIFIAGILIAASPLLCADTILFGLYGAPNQDYSFVRSDAQVPDSALLYSDAQLFQGPFTGWLAANAPAGAGCEAANSWVELLRDGTFNPPFNKTDDISMAIWEFVDPSPGDVLRGRATQDI